MRIRDWSSDVCSSDLGVATARLYPDITLGATVTQGSPKLGNIFSSAFRGFDIFAGLTAPIFHGGTLNAEKRAAISEAEAAQAQYQQTVLEAFGQVADLLQALDSDARSVANQRESIDVARSEEHTSELQSLMRISYAVFCLKKKKNNNTT